MSRPAYPTLVLDRAGLDDLIGGLRKAGWRTIGPRIRDGAIVFDDIDGVGDLPEGWTDEQGNGQYRLTRREDKALFGYAVGPHSWKRYLHEPRLTLFTARRTEDGFRVEEPDNEPEPMAFVGVRACDLAAIQIQDRVLTGGAHVDTHYQRRRERAFIVVVNCGVPSDTCFCVSMRTGPRAGAGYDLALTEILDGEGTRFVVEVGSDRGAEVAERLPARPAVDADRSAALAVTDDAARRMGRTLDTTDIKELLQAQPDHARWDEVAARCLSCANCTMVCPTCFCTSVEDTNDLTGDAATRTRRWDSCFNADYSYIHGGVVRASTKARYRQWLTHKLANWHDQFGESGCVGCGRCVAWCPVGIDLTQEVAAIRGTAP